MTEEERQLARDRAAEISQKVADRLSEIDAINTESVTVSARNVSKVKRGNMSAGQARAAKGGGYQFTAEFYIGSIRIREGFFIPHSATEDDIDIDDLVKFLTEGITV